MKNLFLKHFRFLNILLFTTHLQAGPCFSLPRQDQNQELLLFTHHHIASQKEKALKKHSKEIIWKTQPYTHWKYKQKTFYTDLPFYMKQHIVEFAGLDEPKKNTANFHTHLQRAISHSDLRAVQLLIALGVDIDGNTGKCKQTPLLISIKKYALAHHSKKQAYAIFKYLLARGANYNKANSNDQSTPLHQAATEKNTIPFLQDLLKMPNINVNALNLYEKTALDCAIDNAMNKNKNVEYRKYSYTACAVLESAGAQSSIMLQPMPTDEQMKQEYELNQPLIGNTGGFMLG